MRRWLASPALVLQRNGYLALAAVTSAAFVLVLPAVADLQAADARAAAAARGVGLSYWFAWFGGSAPGDYSILSPSITSVVGVRSTLVIATVVIALIARPLCAGTVRPRSGAYVVVVCAGCNLWSGRVAFALGAALALLGLVALRRSRPWVAGGLTMLAALASPLAAAFALLGLSGFAIHEPAWRARLLPVGILGGVGLAVPAVAFGVPGTMPYSVPILVWTLAILLGAALVSMPQALRHGIWIAGLVAVLCYLVPNGVGSNMQRYAYLVIPPLVWAQSRTRTSLVVLALVPSIAYGVYSVGGDLVASHQPSAQASYYSPLRAELMHQVGLMNHRVEVIDTPTHRADAALVPTVFLARGWDVQSDTAANPLLYAAGPITAATYRAFLDHAAVAWIAVPSEPIRSQVAEATLVRGSLPYVHEIWHNSGWTLYSVAHPTPIVELPAQVTSATEADLVISVPTATTITIRIHPSKYLQLRGGPTSDDLCLTPVGTSAVRADLPEAGTYRITAAFSVTKMVGADTC